MANIKSVRITGAAPFNLTNHKDTHKWFALMAGPLADMKLTWNQQDTAAWFSTNMYRFDIKGETSMMFRGIEEMVDDFTKAGAQFDSISVIDIEDGHDHWLWERAVEEAKK